MQIWAMFVFSSCERHSLFGLIPTRIVRASSCEHSTSSENKDISNALLLPTGPSSADAGGGSVVALYKISNSVPGFPMRLSVGEFIVLLCSFVLFDNSTAVFSK